MNKIKYEKLYLRNYDYNIALFISELEQLIYKNNGQLCEQLIGNKKQNASFTKYMYQCVNRDHPDYPAILCKNHNYVMFTLNDYVYYLEFPDNPFFNNHFNKYLIDPIDDNYFKCDVNYYMDVLDKELNFLLYYLDDRKEAKKIASDVFKTLVSCEPSELVKERKRIYYGSKYKYAYFHDPKYRTYIRYERHNLPHLHYSAHEVE